ncbi:MAG: methyl-accepting chemotaxis protein [Ignavibacteria bacterium]|jgi:methyl-accepting chemotaxis protein
MKTLFKNMHLRAKLIVSISSIVVLSFILVLYVVFSDWQNNAQKEALDHAWELARCNAEKISNDLNKALYTAKTLASGFEAFESIPKEQRRNAFIQILQATLKANTRYSSIWTCWERNALDGMDDYNKFKEGHDETGRFIPNMVNENGVITLTHLNSYKNESTDNYYSIVKSKGKEIITEPAIHTFNGKKVLSTTLAVPIIKDGLFVGAVGVNLTLDYFQELVAEIKPYDVGVAALFSNLGMVTGHFDTSRIGKNARKTEKDMAGDKISGFVAAMEKGEEIHFTTYVDIYKSDTEILASPIKVGDTDTPWNLTIAIPDDVIFADMNKGIRNSLILAAVALFVVIGIIYYLSRIIINPIFKAKEMLDELNQGSLKMRLSDYPNDEIGEMSKSLNKFADTLHGFVTLMYKVADGEVNLQVPIQSSKDEIGPSLQKIVTTLNELKTETDIMIEKYQDGHTEYQGDANKFKGGYKTIVEGFNKSVFTILTVIRKGTTVLDEVAKGDLTVRMTGEYYNNYKGYQGQINNVGESLENIVKQVTDAVSATASASEQISSASEEMASGAHEQSSQTNEVATAVEEMTKTIIETSQNTDNAANAARKSGNVAKEGGEVVKKTVEGMIRIAEVVKRSADTVQELGKSSDQIGEIVQVINDIADQTNLLALNAAIEAARAGEQGRGFAVVADEVRKLAERTTKATQEIADMIKQIQKDTNGAVKSMELGTEEVEKGRQLADKAGKSLTEIISGAEEVVDLITQVATASLEQSSTAEQISKNIESISSVTEQSAASAQQVAHAAEDLNCLTNSLNEMVSRFRLSENSGYTSKAVSKGNMFFDDDKKYLVEG